MGAIPDAVQPLFAKAMTLLVLSWFFVMTRLSVRVFMIHAFGLDDVFLILALLSFTILTWLTIEDAILPLEAHTKPIAIQLVRYLATSQAMYTVTNIFFKISMGLFFLRFLNSRFQIRFVWLSIGFYTLYSLALLIVISYLFRDPEMILETRTIGHCIHDCSVWSAVSPMNYFAGALNSAIDFAFAVLPIMFLRHALMPKRTKASVCALLCFGLVSGICSVVRLVYVGNLNLNAKGFPNPTAVITSLIELAVAIICISLAACRPLFKSFYNRTVSSLNRSGVHEVYSASSSSSSSRRKPNKDAMHSSSAEDEEMDVLKRPATAVVSAASKGSKGVSTGGGRRDTDQGISRAEREHARGCGRGRAGSESPEIHIKTDIDIENGIGSGRFREKEELWV